MNIIVSISENNNQGNAQGFASHIDFSLPDGETFLRLECLFWNDPPKCFTNNRIIEMYDVRIKHCGRKEWAGNMLWNAYHVPCNYALGLINLLLRSREWQWSEGWEQLSDRISSGQMITGRDLDLEEDIQPTVVNPNQFEIPFV